MYHPNSSQIVLKWGIVKRLFNYLVAMLIFSVAIALFVPSGGMVTRFLIIGGAILCILSLLTVKMVVLDLTKKNVQTRIGIGGLRFTRCVPMSGKVEVRLNRYKRTIWGSSLPINVPLSQVQLVRENGKVIVLDESSNSKKMEELAERLTELLDGMRKNEGDAHNRHYQMPTKYCGEKK